MNGKSLRKARANEPCEQNSIFSLPEASRRRFSLPRRAPGRCRASQRCLFFSARTFWGTLRVLPGRSGTIPRRVGNALDHPWELIGRFGVPEDPPGSDSGSILGAPQTPQWPFCIDFSRPRGSPTKPARTSSALWRLDRPASIDLCRSTSQNENEEQKKYRLTNRRASIIRSGTMCLHRLLMPRI